MNKNKKQKIKICIYIIVFAICTLIYLILYYLHLTTKQNPSQLWELLLSLGTTIPSYLLVYELGKAHHEKNASQQNK